MKRKITWCGPVGKLDDFGREIKDAFVDGATRMGPWAIMTPETHAELGRGLGIGFGQRYERRETAKGTKWVQTEGGSAGKEEVKG